MSSSMTYKGYAARIEFSAEDDCFVGVTVHSPTSLTLCLQGRSHRVFSESGFPDSRR